MSLLQPEPQATSNGLEKMSNHQQQWWRWWRWWRWRRRARSNWCRTTTRVHQAHGCTQKEIRAMQGRQVRPSTWTLYCWSWVPPASLLQPLSHSYTQHSLSHTNHHSWMPPLQHTKHYWLPFELKLSTIIAEFSPDYFERVGNTHNGPKLLMCSCTWQLLWSPLPFSSGLLCRSRHPHHLHPLQYVSFGAT